MRLFHRLHRADTMAVDDMRPPRKHMQTAMPPHSAPHDRRNRHRKSAIVRHSQSFMSLSSSRASTVTSSRASFRSSFVATEGDEIVEDWVYWQRDQANSQCWMKVYAVLQREFLWFFKSAHKGRTNLLQIAVSVVEVSGDRQLRIIDPSGEDLEIWVSDALCFDVWRERLEDAAVRTAQYFEAFPIRIEDLPRNSCYRGSLAEHHRIRKRDRCRAACARFFTRCRVSLIKEDRVTIC